MPTTTARISLLAAAAISLAGCSGPKVSRTISPNLVGTKYARLTGYFATAKAAPGGRHEEEVPGQLQHDIILDEATLMKTGPSESCFDVVVRTESRYDEPLEQLAPKCTANGKSGPVVVESEAITVIDYSFQGMQPVVQAEGVAAAQYMALSIAQPTEQVFRVVGRHAALCCPVGGPGTVTLSLDNSRREFADYDFTLAFEWKLQ